MVSFAAIRQACAPGLPKGCLLGQQDQGQVTGTRARSPGGCNLEVGLSDGVSLLEELISIVPDSVDD